MNILYVRIIFLEKSFIATVLGELFQPGISTNFLCIFLIFKLIESY
jgi:hypothetical protein